MSAAHTPGPWVVSPDHIFRNQADIFEIHWSAIGECITECVHGEANARLIAAAPELLDLHKKHMELMMEIAQELKNPRMPIGQTVEASIRMLALAAKESLDAISKATGATT